MKKVYFNVHFKDVPEVSYLSDNIKLLRGQKGLTQEELAKEFGIKRSLLGAYEEGRAEPSITTLIRMSKVLGITIDELINKPQSKKPVKNLPKPADDLVRKIDLVKFLIQDIESGLKLKQG